jgi:hypothetical protein
MLALTLCGQARSGLVDLVAAPGATAHPAAGPSGGAVTVALDPSELAEPAVFAMMLLGLCLIGYRVSGDSGEKFT